MAAEGSRARTVLQKKVTVLPEKIGQRCARVGAWDWLRVGVGCRGRIVGMVMCKRGCATVVAEGGRVQAVCCS